MNNFYFSNLIRMLLPFQINDTDWYAKYLYGTITIKGKQR